MVPRWLVDRYTVAVDRVSEAAQADVGKALAILDVSDVAAAREAAIAVMKLFLARYTRAVAVVSAAFYDAVREHELGEKAKGGALVDSCWEPASTENAVRALIQVVVDGGTREQFIALLLKQVDYEIKIAANRAVVYSGEHDADV